MRQINPKIIEERKKKILQAVIHHYIKTARPVGSNILNEEYKFNLSPATIRGLMADLENEGYLTHPHTSAGRIPTDKGYRLYVDSLMELQRLVIEEERRARQEYDDRVREMEEILIKTSRVLSALSEYSGFVMAPKLDKNILQYIELMYLSENKILAILVTRSGMVKHKIIEAHIPRERLMTISNLLNDKLQGLPLTEARQRIVKELEEYERQEREILALARSLAQEIFSPEEEIYFEGTANVLSLPEFHDYEPMSSFLRLNSDRELLAHILQEDFNDEGVRVLIGSETAREEFRDLSVVSTVYKEGENPLGILGIIGPKRMEYPKMMALVSAVSKILNKLLSK